MTGREFHELEYALTKVGFHRIDASSDQMLVEMALFRQHRLALHHFRHVVAAEDVEHDGVVLLSVFRPMDDYAVLGGIGLELLQVVSKVCDGVSFDLIGGCAQLLPFGQRLSHSVALLTHAPESVVVMRHLVSILVKLTGSDRMFCTHE